MWFTCYAERNSSKRSHLLICSLSARGGKRLQGILTHSNPVAISIRFNGDADKSGQHQRESGTVHRKQRSLARHIWTATHTPEAPPRLSRIPATIRTLLLLLTGIEPSTSAMATCQIIDTHSQSRCRLESVCPSTKPGICGARVASPPTV